MRHRTIAEHLKTQMLASLGDNSGYCPSQVFLLYNLVKVVLRLHLRINSGVSPSLAHVPASALCRCLTSSCAGHRPAAKTRSGYKFVAHGLEPFGKSMISPNENSEFGDVIYSYTRARAIADGVLVDLTQFPITREQWKLHMACTEALWNIIQSAVEQGNDLVGVLHDIYTVARYTVFHGKASDIVHFQVSIAHKTHQLKLHIGPGDTISPVLTLMLKGED